jgi:protein tyrosine phosphatase
VGELAQLVADLILFCPTVTNFLCHSNPSLALSSHSLDDKARVLVGDNQDYINASYIRMEVGSEELFYISCQGPLPSTMPDFWQMVWENRSVVITVL